METQDTDIEKVIAARIQEAQTKGIAQAVMTVACVLGGDKSIQMTSTQRVYTEYVSNRNYARAFECVFIQNYRFNTDDTISQTEKSLTVCESGKLCFEEYAGEITAYVPGPWEEKLFALVERAKEKTAKEALSQSTLSDAQISAKETERRARWGL